MRDLVQLGLDTPFKLRHANRLPPQLFQRGDSILALVGPFKAVILHDHAYFFGLERSSVRSAVHRLKGALRMRTHSLETFQEMQKAYEAANQSQAAQGARLQQQQQQQQEQQQGLQGEVEEDRSEVSPLSGGAVDATPAHARWRDGTPPSHTSSPSAGEQGECAGGAVPDPAAADSAAAAAAEAARGRNGSRSELAKPLAPPPPPPPLPPPATVSAFELLVTEHLLEELCGAYQRQMRLFQPVVSKLLLGLTHGSEQESMDRLHRLIPIKTGLGNFHMVVCEAVDCLEQLLDSDEDMVALLLSERIKRRGGSGVDAPLEPALHEEVEVMVEAYHRRLVLLKHQVSFLMQRVTSTQEVTAIRIDVARNRIIRTNLHLTMMSVSLASMTTTAGFLGMNLELPTWLDGGFTNPALLDGASVGGGPFLAVTGASLLFGAASYAFGVAHSNGMLRKLSGNTTRDVDDVVALGRIFEDISSIEHSVHEHLARKISKAITKNEFRELLGHETMREVPPRELELIFEIFDVSNDGVIARGEVDAVVEENLLDAGLERGMTRAGEPTQMRK